MSNLPRFGLAAGALPRTPGYLGTENIGEGFGC